MSGMSGEISVYAAAGYLIGLRFIGCFCIYCMPSYKKPLYIYGKVHNEATTPSMISIIMLIYLPNSIKKEPSIFGFIQKNTKSYLFWVSMTR